MRHLTAKFPQGDPVGAQGSLRAPGTHVRVHKVPTTVSHVDCTLTGVVIAYRRCSGAAVLWRRHLGRHQQCLHRSVGSTQIDRRRPEPVWLLRFGAGRVDPTHYRSPRG